MLGSVFVLIFYNQFPFFKKKKYTFKASDLVFTEIQILYFLQVQFLSVFFFNDSLGFMILLEITRSYKFSFCYCHLEV